MVDSPESKSEEGALKVGYATEAQERYPINMDISKCSSSSRAYFLFLEKEQLIVPSGSQLDVLISDIHTDHQVRLGEIWRQVQKHHTNMLLYAVALQDYWSSAPRVRQKGVDHTLNTTPIIIQAQFRNSIRAIIANAPDYDGNSPPTRLQNWKVTEKALRTQLFLEHKNHIVALRLYYEMLLERSKDKQRYVLPPDHPQREDIIMCNRYLRAIDATHQSIAAAKAAHHQQDKRRLRKTQAIPFVTHSFDVTFNMLLDVLPFITEKKSIEHNAVIFALIGPIHDIVEDTRLSVQGLVDGFLKRLADKYDSSLDPVIQSGFGLEPERIKATKLDLIRGRTRTTLIHIMRILSNNTELSDAEKKAIIQLNIAGKGRTSQLLDAPFQTGRSWGINYSDLPKPRATFKKYHNEYDNGKLTKFLLRLHSITGRERRRQQALIIKTEDKANNIETLPGLPPLQQRRDIRACITRLIAWIMLDHDNDKCPLYNSAPRLIDNTVKAYERLMGNHFDIIEKIDHEYLAQLRQWQMEVVRYELPENAQGVIDQYRDLYD